MKKANSWNYNTQYTKCVARRDEIMALQSVETIFLNLSRKFDSLSHIDVDIFESCDVGNWMENMYKVRYDRDFVYRERVLVLT